MSSRPNVVYIFTDQQSANAMSCTGNDYLETPAMDRLAEMGTRFDSAYTSFPLCVPARMSMFSGRMPHELDIYANCPSTEEPPGVPMLGRLMNDAGYDCQYVGKWHQTVPEDADHIHGFTEILPGGGYGGPDDEKADNAIEYIEQDHGDPFFMVVSFNNPHDACELARGQDLRMQDLPPMPPKSELPPVPENWEPPEREPEVLREFQDNNESIGIAHTWDELETREFRWGYNRLVEMVDQQIGRVLEALEDEGLIDNTLVIFSSDHGDGQGHHRWNQKWSLYDESARVPFIVKAPAQEAHGEVDDRPVNASLDLMPTILDYAGVEIPQNCAGKSHRSILEANRVSHREYVATETGFGIWAPVGQDEWPKGRMIRTDRYKYMAYDAGDKREQLFDMEEDPGETVDLADKESSESILRQMRDHLADWVERTDDGFECPDGAQ